MLCSTLVLSGGAMKGVSMLGAIRFIEEQVNLRDINRFYGTSVGALLSVMIAIGYRPLELYIHFTQFSLFFEPHFSKQNVQLFDFEPLINTLQAMILSKTQEMPTMLELFKKFGKKVFIVTYNYTKANMEILSYRTTPNLLCIDAIRMSCSLPFVFKKTIVNDDLYLDGGLVCNFPLNIACKHRCKHIVAICIKYPYTRSTNDNMLTLFYNMIFTPIDYRVNEIILKYGNDCIYIELSVNIAFTKFNLSVRESLSAFVQGYRLARAAVNDKMTFFKQMKT